jgi:hypothetical protein
MLAWVWDVIIVVDSSILVIWASLLSYSKRKYVAGVMLPVQTDQGSNMC